MGWKGKSARLQDIDAGARPLPMIEDPPNMLPAAKARQSEFRRRASETMAAQSGSWGSGLWMDATGCAKKLRFNRRTACSLPV